MDSNHPLLARTCAFAGKMLDAAFDNTLEGNLDPIFSQDAELKAVYDNLFDTVLPQISLTPKSGSSLLDQCLKEFAKRKQASETMQKLDTTDRNNASLISQKSKPKLVHDFFTELSNTRGNTQTTTASRAKPDATKENNAHASSEVLVFQRDPDTQQSSLLKRHRQTPINAPKETLDTNSHKGFTHRSPPLPPPLSSPESDFSVPSLHKKTQAGGRQCRKTEKC